ncbi:MAG: T9SS type A sorting domain-containing protein [candidate division WOR-3 bacterium]|nr:T9SS type A sorting domain-containing protein [candidate division WOR-3 bacterium]
MRYFIFLLPMLVWAQLNYLPASNGFYENPALEGGRTELEFADINNDGNVDILSIGDHGSPYINTQEHGVMVWFGDGQGNWSLYQYGNFGYGGIAVGDVNWDGNWDVGYGMHHNYSGEDLGDDMLEVALGDGTGMMWYAWDDSLVRGGTVWGMFNTDFADVNHDGLLDIGACSFGYGVGLRVFLNLGNGTWRKSFGLPESSNCAMEFYFRDVNRDGNPDIICAVAGPAVYFGDGTGNFYPGDSGLPRSNYGLAGISPGDVDNDGGDDLAFVNNTRGIEVWRWNSALRVWQNFSGNLPVADSFYATQLVDMNRDGFIDLLGLQRRAVKIWAGDGQGNWTEMASVPLNNRIVDYEAFRAGADFDHNGYPDFALVVREGAWPNYKNYAYAFRESSPKESLRIFPVFPRGGERFWQGSVQFIDWWSEAPGAESSMVRLEFSTTGSSGPWSLIADSLPNGGRFQWLVPDSISSSNCYIKYTVFKGGEQYSAVTARAFFIGDPTGIEQRSDLLKVGEGIKIQSNPAKGRVRVKFGSTLASQKKVILCDQSGRLVKEITVPAGGTEMVLETRDLGAGVYFINVEGSQVAKFVIAK